VFHGKLAGVVEELYIPVMVLLMERPLETIAAGRENIAKFAGKLKGITRMFVAHKFKRP
jgi:hypothetical protein